MFGIRTRLDRLYRYLHYGKSGVPAKRMIGGMHYEPVKPLATYAPWLDDQNFLRIYGDVRSHTLVDQYRCFELWELVGQTAPIPGDILEVGSWRGGSGAIIASRAKAMAPSKRVYLCDTFEGVVKASAKDSQYRGGEHADTSEETVKNLLSRHALQQAKILRGIFPDAFKETMSGESFSFVHIDVDVYQSAKETFAFVWPRMPKGGVVVFDDYGFDSCDGIPKLVAEFRGDSDKLVVHNLNGHALAIKV
jgi:O-methyltransferase